MTLYNATYVLPKFTSLVFVYFLKMEFNTFILDKNPNLKTILIKICKNSNLI